MSIVGVCVCVCVCACVCACVCVCVCAYLEIRCKKSEKKSTISYTSLYSLGYKCGLQLVITMFQAVLHGLAYMHVLSYKVY